jgi:hypothetical protein
VGHFCPPGSGSGSTDPIEWDPDPQPWLQLLLRICNRMILVSPGSGSVIICTDLDTSINEQKH